MVKKFMHILFLSCLKATELVEKRFHFELTAKEKIQLRMHVMMCDACTNFEKQSQFIEKGIEEHHKKLHPKTDIDALKKRISISLGQH